MRTLDDASALNSGEIDVAARIGWIIRMARVTTPDAGDTRLQSMAGRIGSSAAHLSRVETGQRRDSALTHRYEEALGIPRDALWAPVALLCRSFPRQSPRDTNPVVASNDVHEFSHLTSRLLDRTEPVTGSDWLRWARSLSLDGNIGLPVDLFTRVATRLVSELTRSVSHAYPARYESLALLRCSHYGDLVLDVARATFSADGTHGRTDLSSAVGEAVTPEATKWALDLLEDPGTCFHGALALETMGQIADDTFWDDLTTPLLTHFENSEPDSTQEHWVTHLMRLVPREAWRRAGATPSRPLPPGPALETFHRSADNELWAWCVATSDELTAPLDLGHQPLLARLLFEIAFGPWETRALTSYMLLNAVPQLSAGVAQRLADFAVTHPESPVRERVLRRLSTMMHGNPVAGLDAWLDDPDARVRNAALAVSGGAGLSVPFETLVPALLSRDTSLAARYAAGMSTVPVIDDLLARDELPADVREELLWWRDKGGRITL